MDLEAFEGKARSAIEAAQVEAKVFMTKKILEFAGNQVPPEAFPAYLGCYMDQMFSNAYAFAKSAVSEEYAEIWLDTLMKSFSKKLGIKISIIRKSKD